MAPARSAASSTEAQPNPNDPSPGPRKRRRIPVACTACRNKKTRCDGERPVCASCQAQGIDCEYAENANLATATISKALFDGLEARLAAAERDIRILKGQTDGGGPGPARMVIAASFRMPNEDAEEDPAAALESSDETARDGDESVVSPDATVGVGTIEFTDEEDSAYFGPSSNIAFIRIIRFSIASCLRALDNNAANGESTNTYTSNSSSQHRLTVSRPTSPVPKPASVSWVPEGVIESDVHTVPPEPEMLRLCQIFFSDTCLLFPYVHEESFWRNYHSARASGFRRFRQTWRGLLNMVLAMATSIGTGRDSDLDAVERGARSDKFFSRAKALCLNQMIAGASVEIIQVMLLMTQYLQGTRRSLKTWTIHGLAVKAALQLGLHSQEALSRLEPLDREVRIRTWYACVVLDRTLSTTLGRPSAIPEKYIAVPLPSHFLPSPTGSELVPWSSEENSTLFWNATVNLYRIASNLVGKLYGSNLGVSSGVSFADLTSSIIQVEQQLLGWQASLPDSLRLVQPDELARANSTSIHVKLRIILTLRYMHLRLLAHRPILDKYLQLLDGTPRQGHEAIMLAQYGHRSKSVCFETAETIVNIVKTITTSGQLGFLGAWWFSLHYTFSAALVIVAIQICDAASLDPNHGRNDTSISCPQEVLERAISCLPLLNQGNRMADKCAQFTIALWHCVQGILESRRSSRGPTPAVPVDVLPPEMYFGQDTNFDFGSFGMDSGIPHVMDSFETTDMLW